MAFRNSNRKKGDFSDRGFLGPNENRGGSDTAPTHRGLVTLSVATLKALNERYQNGDALEIDLAGWRKDDNPRMVSLQIKLSFTEEEREEYNASKGRRPGGGRKVARARPRDEEEDEDDDRPRRKVRARDPDDDMDDEIPFNQRDKKKAQRYRDSDMGDENDL